MKNIYPTLVLFIAFLAPFSTLKADPVKVASVEGITEYHHTNGLKVLLFPDPSK